MRVLRGFGSCLLAALTLGATSHVAVAGHTCDHPPRSAPDAIRVPEPEPAQIRPARDRVRLANGESVRRVYTLTRPASPTPVDIFFLIDGTNSMHEEICGVQLGLIDIALALHDAGIDAQFGVGEYRDYRLSGYGSPDSRAYQRRRAIGPLDNELIRAVSRMTAHGGTSDGYTSALAALYQTATGQGQDVRPRGHSEADIAPDRGAEFRSDALKIVVNVTDFGFRHAGRGYPGPAFEDVADTLRERGILQIGIDAGDGQDLRPMADATGARAPEGGVDCDGDGRLDVQVGEPLVCELEPPPVVSFGETPNELELAPAIVEMVKAVRDVSQVRYRAQGDPRIVARLAPKQSRPIDLKADNVERFAVRFRCRHLAGIERVRLSAHVRDNVIAQARTHVTCDPPPSVPVISAPAAAAAAPTTPHAPQPQAQNQAQGQANAALQHNVAAVPQQQSQLQVALQQANDDAEFAMQARRRSAPHPTVPAAAAIAVAAGVALSRQRARTRTVTTRKEPR